MCTGFDILPSIHRAIQAPLTQVIIVPYNEKALAEFASDTPEIHLERLVLQLQVWTEDMLAPATRPAADVVDCVSGDCGPIKPAQPSSLSSAADPRDDNNAVNPASTSVASMTESAEHRLSSSLAKSGWSDVQFIGKGAHGLVFRAISTDGEVQALKWLPTSSAQQIISESNTLRALSGNPHLTAWRGAELVEGLGWVLIMPFYRSDTIAALAARYSPSEYIVPFMQQLLMGLRELHEAGWAHCDVKPSNFRYDHCTQHGVLVDLGLALRVSNPQTLSERSSAANNDPLVDALSQSARRRTHVPAPASKRATPQYQTLHSATHIGTVQFRSPEALMGAGNWTQQSDVWAAGLVLCQLMSAGKPLWTSDNNADTLLEVRAADL